MERTELPIAVFDSGLGGISVLRALVQRLPGEDFLYFGDSANAPYGERPAEEVRRRPHDARRLRRRRRCHPGGGRNPPAAPRLLAPHPAR